jgi:hypothetical protein
VAIEARAGDVMARTAFGGGLIEIHPAAVWRSTGGF